MLKKFNGITYEKILELGKKVTVIKFNNVIISTVNSHNDNDIIDSIYDLCNDMINTANDTKNQIKEYLNNND